MRYIMREIAYLFIMLLHKIQNRNLRIEFRAKASLNSKFEGYNKLSHHSFFSGELGYASYVGANSIIGGKIGRYCSIAENVIFLSKTHPTHNFVSTHPCFYSLKRQAGFSYAKEQSFNEEPRLEGSNYSIEIGNDVYIGYGVTVIGPCRIGNGAVIAAGTVVTCDVPDYAIMGGVPGKIIRYRFSEEQIKILLRACWWDKSPDWLCEHIDDFSCIEKFMKNISSNKD